MSGRGWIHSIAAPARAVLLAGLLLPAACGTLPAEGTPAPPTAADAAASIDQLMQPYSGEVPGASVLVLKDGKTVFAKGYGLADMERRVPADARTNYRLASVSKPFTAAAVLLLAQDGKLSLEDPVKRWLPSLPASADPITVRHLLNHTSGLLDYEDLMPKPYQGQILDAGVLDLLAQHDRLNFPVGSQYRYSNSGYALLALIVERVSGQSFPTFLRERIFLPLGMRDTVARVDDGPAVAHRAFGYSAEGAGWKRTDQSPYSAVLGDGGIYSSIEDLARWDAAWTDDRLFTAATRALATGRHAAVREGGESSWYGYGWRVSDDGSRQWHNGESIGFRNSFTRWPTQGVTVVILSNRNEPTPSALARRIGALYLPPRH